jgi:ferredoxin
MPAKYMIHTTPTSHRFKAVTKSGIIAWEEGCLKCAVCVKKRCVYGVYEQRGLDSRQMIDSIDNQCMNCFRCIQGCPKELIHKSVSPEYKAIGDAHWTPDIVARLWYQAETGKIPVSGAGYPGPFSGPGFDSMWTDMSEIVRPTRDGIHGREYISTAIDLGQTPDHLIFNENGALVSRVDRVVDIPLPVILRVPEFGSISEKTLKGWAMAAKQLRTFLAIPRNSIKRELEDYRSSLLPLTSPGPIKTDEGGEAIRLYEVAWSEDWEKTVNTISRQEGSAQVSIRLPSYQGLEEKALSLAKAGVSLIHVEATSHGRAMDDESVYLKDAIRSVHQALVNEGIRDGITLLASGGLSMAEHVAKSIICGADGVMIDFPILIALECRMCRRCTKGLSCPVEIESAPSSWVASRVINLVGAWQNQLLEMMGAMGIRDVRRLRGEVGRAMFFEELDKATFDSMGHVEEGCELE